MNTNAQVRNVINVMDSLSLFNQQVLQIQDDAYTLAWYMLGDAVEAETVMQEAVQAAFSSFSSKRTDCRLLILKQIVEQCRTRKPAASSSVELGIFQGLCSLEDQDREILLLIDVLGLRYSEVACIVNQPLKEIKRLLARARWKAKDAHKSTD